MTLRAGALTLVLAAVAASADAQPQPFPARSIRMVVATEPGGQSDALARAIGPEMAKELGVSIVPENRGGAGGSIGALLVAQAAADGYTILIGGANALVSAPLLNGNTAYDPMRQFAPIGAIARVPYAIGVAPHVPARNLTELVVHAKNNPGALTYGSGGIGSTSHLILALVEARTGAKFLNVPFRGAGAAVQELLGGRIDVVGSELGRLMPLAQSGALRIIATTGERRSRRMPMLPTASEQGLPGFDVDTWYGLLAPAGTPEPVIAILSRALAAALRAPEVVQLIESREYEWLPPGPAALRELIVTETRDMRTLIETTGLAAPR